jgi:hypothetical protein
MPPLTALPWQRVLPHNAQNSLTTANDNQPTLLII